MSNAVKMVANQQSAFLETIMRPCAANGAQLGLSPREAEVYRNNIEAMAINALRITYSTLPELLGEKEFRELCLALLNYFPPDAGDWGLWGRQLPYLLAQRSIAEEYPFVVPMARLDWRLHRASRATDDQLQQETLSLLQEVDPDQLLVDFSSHVSLLSSRYPLLELREKAAESGSAKGSLSIRDKAYRMVIERPLLSVQSRYLDQSYYRFTLGLLQGETVGQMLESVSADAFDFSHWLQQAIQHNWIRRLYTSK